MIGDGLLLLTRLVVGTVAGGALVVFGLFGFGWLGAAPGIALMAGGELVLMWLVADELCPDASPQVVAGLKLGATAVFWVAAVGAIWQVWHWWPLK